jgi:hypothetical protein
MSADNRHDEPSHSMVDKREGDTPKQSKSRMETAAYLLGLVVVIVGLLSAAFFSVGHRDLGLWATFVAILFAVAGGFCWYQETLWKKDKETARLAASDNSRASQGLTQRAWLSISKVYGDPPGPAQGEFFKIIVYFSNKGKTAAKNVISHVSLQTVPETMSPDFDYVSKTEAMPYHTLLPDEKIGMALPLGGVPITAEKAAALRDGKLKAYVVGRVDYEDLFGKSHWFTFCHVYAGIQGEYFVLGEKGNDSDK